MTSITNLLLQGLARKKIKEAIYINAIIPTESMVHRKILNVGKGYDFDPIWSGFNKDFKGISEKRIHFYL